MKAVISNFDSSKLKIVSFFLIVMVLYIHSYYLEGEAFPVASYIQDAIDKGLCSMAVPMFFCISGFLFFHGISNVNEVFVKQKRQVRTLLLPYMLWNIIFILWYAVMALAPQIAPFVNSDMIGGLKSATPWDAFCLLFVEPAGFHLWFLRDLIVFVFFTPTFYFCLKYVRWVMPLLLALVSLKVYFFNGMFFFVMGGAISMFGSLESVGQWCKCLFIPALLGWILFSVLLPLYPVTFNLLLLAQLCGMVAVWRLFDWLTPKLQTGKLSDWHLFDYTFFIYAFHEPFFNIVKKLTLRILGTSDASLTLLYLVNPLIAVTLIWCVALCFQKLLPRTYSILTGGR